jgi:hypothetical protein
MRAEDSIREITLKACREALEARSEELAEDLSRRLESALASQEPPPNPQPIVELRDGAALIAGSRTQSETLDTLLAAAAAITPKCGLLIVRGAQAAGWSCQPVLAAADNFKRATMDCSRGAAAKVTNSATAVEIRASELDPVFVARLGLDADEVVLLLPVVLKDRVAALLIALGRENEDLPALELLMQVARLALDLQAYRKAPPAENGNRPSAPAARAATPPSRPSPAPVALAPAPPPLPPAAPVAQPKVLARPIPAAAAVMAPPEPPPVVDEVHEKAARFARLLVDEIKLYNQSKVAEGRANGDLYRRLREDIEKSRAAYQKRYGESVKDTDYFTRELLRILADNNRALMGADFPS